MKFDFKTLAAFISLSAIMTGCANDSTGSGSSPLLNTADKTTVSEESESSKSSEAPAATDCKITLSSDGASVNGNGAEFSDKTIRITRAGVYELSGSCPDGRIEIEAGKNADVTLVLNGAELTSTNGSVIDCESAKTLTLYTNANTENSLSDSAGYGTDDEADAAVFTRSDLIIAGEGSLKVNGVYGDALKCKDALSVNGGKLSVTAADDGITGKDSVTVSGGTLDISADGDGIKSTNDTDAGRGFVTVDGGELSIASGADGIQAETALTVNGGKITIVSGGEAADAEVTASGEPWDFDRRGGNSSQSTDNSSSMKGLKAGGDLTINGGELDIKSADDSVHSNADIKVNGGTLLLSSCDDGIHADENLTVTNGTITVSKSYEGLEGKSIDIGGGVIAVKAADDGLNAAGGDNAGFFGFGQASDDYYISISGGEITVDADGDGVDSNGTIAQSGGTLTIYGPTSSGNGALDYEVSYAVSGGTLTALGSRGMAQAPSTLSQPCLAISADAPANSKIEVKANGGTVLETTTPKAAQSLIFSSDKMKSGTEYEIYVGGELVSTVTATDGISGDGANGQGGMGGFGGGRPNGGGFGGGQRPGGSFGGGTPPEPRQTDTSLPF